jgi:uncharacterized damage-inducible protein DinB
MVVKEERVRMEGPGSPLDTRIETLCWLIEEAFEGDPDQSLLASLRDVRDDDWTRLVPGGGRSIADILEHVGWAKWMYTDYAFGAATLRGDRPPLVPENGARSRPRAELVTWLNAGHNLWLAAVRALADDAELEKSRLTNWGEQLPTRAIIRIMIGHDFYHAGEINHLRALLQGTDRWPYD